MKPISRARKITDEKELLEFLAPFNSGLVKYHWMRIKNVVVEAKKQKEHVGILQQKYPYKRKEGDIVSLTIWYYEMEKYRNESHTVRSVIPPVVSRLVYEPARIRRFMAEENISDGQVAKVMRVSVRTIQRIKRGRGEVSINTLRRVLRYLKMQGYREAA